MYTLLGFIVSIGYTLKRALCGLFFFLSVSVGEPTLACAVGSQSFLLSQTSLFKMILRLFCRVMAPSSPQLLRQKTKCRGLPWSPRNGLLLKEWGSPRLPPSPSRRETTALKEGKEGGNFSLSLADQAFSLRGMMFIDADSGD